MLNENGEIICDDSTVYNTFNDFFVNIANDIGNNLNVTDMTVQEIIALYNDHPNVKKIQTSKCSYSNIKNI